MDTFPPIRLVLANIIRAKIPRSCGLMLLTDPSGQNVILHNVSTMLFGVTLPLGSISRDGTLRAVGAPFSKGTGMTEAFLDEEKYCPKNAQRLARLIAENAREAKFTAVQHCQSCGDKTTTSPIKRWSCTAGSVYVHTPNGRYPISISNLSQQINEGGKHLRLQSSLCRPCRLATKRSAYLPMFQARCPRCSAPLRTVAEFCDGCTLLAGGAVTVMDEPQKKVDCPVCFMRPAFCVCNHLAYNAVKDWFVT